MRKLKKSWMTLTFCCVSLMFLNSCNSTRDTKAYSVSAKKLSAAQSLRVKRFLHPMPQELRLSEFAYEIEANNCGLKTSKDSSPEEKQAIDDFKSKWLKKRGTALKAANGELNIFAGLLKNSPELQEAAENGVFDDKYLSERANPEQAYAISTVAEDGEIKVYVAANAPVGLYYGLLTLEQLFDSLSKEKKLLLPDCRIVDWPDLKERGFCANTGGGAFYKDETGLMKRYSDLKLNIHYDWIYMKVSKDKKISYSKSYRNRYLIAKKYFVQEIPILVHMDYLFRPQRNALSNFPEIASQGKTGKRIYGSHSGRTFCYGNPKSQKVMDQIFIAIAKADLGNRLQVWLGEHATCCHCELCKGDLRQHFINEVKHVVHAWREAKKINPNLKIDILLSQGTYAYNYDLLEYIPKDVGIDIYSGSVDNNTYKIRHGEYYLTPQAEEIVNQGYETGGVPSVGPSILWENIMFPSFMPQFVKLRMSESKQRGLDRIMIWMSGVFHQEINLEAIAEYSWNIDGRTSKEFIAAWAARQNMNNPDQIAEIIKTIEYPIRAVGAGMRARKMDRSIKRMVSLLNEKKPYWSEYFEFLKGFEYGGNPKELARCLKKCDKAIKLAKELKNPELIAGAKLMRQWIAILECYSKFLKTKDSDEKLKIRQEVKNLASKLPNLRENWIKLKSLNKRSAKSAQKGFDKAMKEFEKLK